jgi:hypothetical protein
MAEHTAKREGKAAEHPEFNTEELIKPRFKPPSWKLMVPLWISLVLFAVVGYYRHWDATLVVSGAFVVALLSNAIAWLAGIIALVPILGPLLVKVLALPFIWLLNAIGYVISLLAIRRGYSKDVLTYRGLTIALIVGIVIGYVVGKFV